MLNKDLYLSLPRPVLTSIIRVISNISRQFRLMIRNFFVISVYVHLFKTFQRVICVISGAIRHDGHLYILRRHMRYTIPSMRIYEDTPPFDLIMLTTVEEVNQFRYFGFDAASSCFYILNSASSCIWKFTIEDHKLTKWLCNLVQPISLTVSTDGQVVVLRDGEASTELEIYGPNATLVRRNAMPYNIIIFTASWIVRSLHRRYLIKGINNTFIIISDVGVEYDSDDRAMGYIIVYSNASTTNAEIIGKAKHIFSRSVDSYWRLKLNGSTSDFCVDIIYNNYDIYLIAAEQLFEISQCV